MSQFIYIIMYVNQVNIEWFPYPFSVFPLGNESFNYLYPNNFVFFLRCQTFSRTKAIRHTLTYPLKYSWWIVRFVHSLLAKSSNYLDSLGYNSLLMKISELTVRRSWFPRLQASSERQCQSYCMVVLVCFSFNFYLVRPCPSDIQDICMVK